MNDEYIDKEIQCVESGCGAFIWSARDQAFYAEKGFTPPKRCKEHARARRAFFDNNPQKAQGGKEKRPERRERHGDRDYLGE